MPKQTEGTKPPSFSRNASGLLVSSDISYKFDDNGLVDWRGMIDKKWLVPNRDRTSETNVSKLSDSQLIILLGGIKELAQIRGYTDLTYEVTSPSIDYVIATCKITWLPNYETEGTPVTFSAIGDASISNTSDFARNFLGAIAENRAFVRCVRNFLRINIVAQDELAAKAQEVATHQSSSKAFSSNLSESDPHFLLEKVMSEKGVDLDKIKKALLKDGYEGAEDIGELKDIPKPKVFNLISRIQAIN
jgi:hypothetical protein